MPWWWGVLFPANVRAAHSDVHLRVDGSLHLPQPALQKELSNIVEIIN